MTETIQFNDYSLQRIVRSKRTYEGVTYGAIRDDGWLVTVYLDGPSWYVIRPIRKLRGE